MKSILFFELDIKDIYVDVLEPAKNCNWFNNFYKILVNR